MTNKISLIKLKNLNIEYSFMPSSTKQSKNIIFINGLNDPFQNHLDILKNISKQGFNVYAVNLPGHAGSQTSNILSWDLLEDLIKEFKHKLFIRNPYLIGYSLGAAVAYQTYSHNSKQFKGATLWAPLLYSVNPLNPQLIAKGTKFVLEINKDKHLSSKPSPYSRMSLGNYLKYLAIVKELSLEPTNLKNIWIKLNEKDLLIDNTKIQEAFDIDKNNIEIFPDIGHQVYYLTSEQIESITKSLISNIS